MRRAMAALQSASVEAVGVLRAVMLDTRIKAAVRVTAARH